MMDELRDLGLLTLRDPAAALRRLQGLNLSDGTRWSALFLVVSLSAIMAWLASQLFPVHVETGLNLLVGRPFLMAGAQLGGLVLAAVLIGFGGRAFGGQGRFEDALLMVVWIEALLLVLQAAQVVLMLIFPLIASLLGLAGLALFIYLLVSMTKALHGFQSTALVVIGMIATALIATFVLTFFATAFGLIEVPA